VGRPQRRDVRIQREQQLPLSGFEFETTGANSPPSRVNPLARRGDSGAELGHGLSSKCPHAFDDTRARAVL
jgi:hypothetical protein